MGEAEYFIHSFTLFRNLG